MYLSWHASTRCENCVSHNQKYRADAEADELSGLSRKHSMRSRSNWFTEFCNSQCSSHFAAPFIGVRAQTSTAERFSDLVFSQAHTHESECMGAHKNTHVRPNYTQNAWAQCRAMCKNITQRWLVCGDSKCSGRPQRCHNKNSVPPSSKFPQGHRWNKSQLHPCRQAHTMNAWIIVDDNANDPSAGSPTETLLRLLLPLNDKV